MKKRKEELIEEQAKKLFKELEEFEKTLPPRSGDPHKDAYYIIIPRLRKYQKLLKKYPAYAEAVAKITAYYMAKEAKRVAEDLTRYYEREEEEEPVELASIGEGIEKELREMGVYPFLFCIDAHTVFYRNAVAGAPGEFKGGTIARYQTSLEKHLMLLRWFSVDYRIPTFVTSYPKSELFYAMLPVRIAKVEKEIKQARQEGRNADVVRLMDELQRLKDETRVPYIGGRPYQHWPKVIFELRAPDETSPLRVLKLIKHRSHGYVRTEFRLTQKGVEV